MNLKKLLGVSFLGFLSIGTAQTSAVFAEDNNTYSNLIGEINYLENGDTIEYTGTLSDTIEIYITFNALAVNNEININLVIDNFILANIPNNGEAFHIYNSTQYTVNVTFIVSGQNNRIYSGNDMAPIYLEATNGTSGDINTIWTMGDTSCDTNAELTLGTDNENIQMVSMITRSGCNGTDKLKDCTTEFYLAEATDDFNNHDVYPYETFNLWGNTGHEYDEEDIEWYYSDVPCQEEGYWEVDCQKCERTLHYSIPLEDHNWEYADENDEEGYKAPTCTENGYWDKTCTICFETEREILQATGHTLPQIPSEYVVEPTCTRSGTVKYICTVCNEPVIQEVEPIEGKHNWGDWEETTAPDCTHSGVETRTCLDCGETQTNELPPRHLIIEDDRIEVPGTCLNRGYFQYTCQLCGEIIKDEFDDNPYNHEGKQIVVVDTPSTAEEEGIGHIEWSCCGAIVLNENTGEPLKVTICKEDEHVWELTRTITEPNCGREGSGIYTCSVCGITKEDSIPNDDYYHQWGEWETIIEPDCESKDGLEQVTCTVCGEVHQETIPAGHIFLEDDNPDDNFIEPTCISPAKWTYTCARCNKVVEEIIDDELDPNNHVGVKKLVVDEAATTESEGKGHYEWSCCGKKETDATGGILTVSIPKLTRDSSKTILSDIILGKDENDQTVTDNTQATEALQKLNENDPDDNTLMTIANAANQAFEAVANEQVTEEEKAVLIEIVQAATESAVIAGSKLYNVTSEMQSLTVYFSERTIPSFKKTLPAFYSLQYNTILNITDARNAQGSGDTFTGKIDYYEKTAEDYRTAVECINTSVDHMTSAAGMIRVCSNEKISTIVNEYIESFGTKSFEFFNKEEADEEFAINVYQAMLINMQDQTIANLNESYEKLAKTLEGTALDELTEEYNAQLEACKDIGQFEWLIIEIMRQKYNSYLYEQYNKNNLTFDEYKAKFIHEGEANLAKFKEDVYMHIFYKWALGDNSDKYEDYGITLQELTDTTITTITLKEKKVELSKAPTAAEVTVAVVFGTLSLITAGALVTLEVLKKKKGVVAA